MHPTLTLPFLGTTVGSADLHIVLAAAFAILVGPAWVSRLERIDARTARRAILLLTLAALIGGRLHFILINPGAYRLNPWAALYLWRGGFHVPGGMIGVLITAPLVARYFGLSFGRLMDAVVPVIGVSLIIARFGCFLQGCCFGDVCHHAGCVPFPPGSGVYVAQDVAGLLPSNAPHSLSVHPLQLYFIGSYALMVAAALWVRRRKRYDGQVALVAFLTLFASALGLEFLRSDLMFRTYWGPLPQLAWTAMALVLATVAALVVFERRRPGPPS